METGGERERCSDSFVKLDCETQGKGLNLESFRASQESLYRCPTQGTAEMM